MSFIGGWLKKVTRPSSMTHTHPAFLAVPEDFLTTTPSNTTPQEATSRKKVCRHIARMGMCQRMRTGRTMWAQACAEEIVCDHRHVPRTRGAPAPTHARQHQDLWVGAFRISDDDLTRCPLCSLDGQILCAGRARSVPGQPGARRARPAQTRARQGGRPRAFSMRIFSETTYVPACITMVASGSAASTIDLKSSAMLRLPQQAGAASQPAGRTLGAPPAQDTPADAAHSPRARVPGSRAAPLRTEGRRP